MAYLTEHLSKQEITLFVNGLNQGASANVTADSASRSDDTGEQSNFQIARQLNEHKLRLIDVVTQFPVTALWLIREYEKNKDFEQAEEAGLMSDLATVLADIKKNFYALVECAGQEEADTANHIKAAMELLTDALRQFPFGFSDLTKICDLILYGCQVRGLVDSVLAGLGAKKADRLMTRLASWKRKNSHNIWQRFDICEDIFGNRQQENFLFLSTELQADYAIELVDAEQRWLSARQTLASANIKLVMFIANQYKSGFLDFDDLVQEGQTGLLKAVDKFDYRLGFQFSTYAGYWIRQAISRSLSRSERIVRVPCGQVANINKVFRAKNELSAQTGQDPSIQQLADYTKLSTDEIYAILMISQSVVSLEGSDDDEDAFAPIDFLEQQVFTPAYQTMAKKELHDVLSKAIETLNPREAKIICCHFGVDAEKEMTLQEIGSELNLTRERVRQIQVMALNKIKLNFGAQLDCFLTA